jgi:hypothetical protein
MDEKRAASWAGLSVIGGLLVGFVSLLAGVLIVINKADIEIVDVDYVGAGLCFLASALAFGFLANAIYRE